MKTIPTLAISFSVLFFVSCEKEEEFITETNETPLKEIARSYESVWETDSVVMVSKSSVNETPDIVSFDKSQGYYSFNFTTIDNKDLSICENSSTPEVLKSYFIDHNGESINTGNCFFNYKKDDDKLYKTSPRYFSEIGFDWSSIDPENQYEIIEETSGSITLKNLQENFPSVGTTTETFYYFTIK